MNSAGREAIKTALANVEDNLYRYTHFTIPDSVTGNGEKVSDVIADLQRQRDELEAALVQAEAS